MWLKNPPNEKNTLPFTAFKNILLLRSCKRKRRMKHISASTFKLGNRLSRLNRITFSISMKPSIQKCSKSSLKILWWLKLLENANSFLAEIPDCPKKMRNHFSVQNLGEKDGKSNFIETRTTWSTPFVDINQRLKIEILKKWKIHQKKYWLISDRKGKHSKEEMQLEKKNIPDWEVQQDPNCMSHNHISQEATSSK